jgi:hypothetical protein
MLPLKLLWVRSSTANDNELMQNGEGTNPWKLLLLALSTTRLLLVFSHTAYGNSPVNKLLEMFNVGGYPKNSEYYPNISESSRHVLQHS